MAEHPEAWKTVQQVAGMVPGAPKIGLPHPDCILTAFAQALLDLRNYKADAQ